MLDQVKSGTTARIATARPSPNSGEGSVSRRVSPPSGSGGADNEPSSGKGFAERRESGEPDIDERAHARQAIDSAMKELLVEARDRMPETKADAAPVEHLAPEESEKAFQRATSAYSQQTNLGGREKVLRPGVVYSAVL